MRSPIQLDRDIDPKLIYAPHSARRRTTERFPVARPASKALCLARSRPRFSGDRAMLELQRQLALNPDLIPEPRSQADAFVRPLLVRICSVSALAAFVAWGLASYSEVKKTPATIAANPSIPATAGDHGPRDAQRLPLRRTMAQPDEALPFLSKTPPVVVATVARASGPAVTASAVVGTARIETPGLAATSPQRANDQRALRLDRDEIETLVKRAQDFVANGDMAAARLLLRRAAESGSAEAALALGTTYDPVVLQRLGAIGTTADPAPARRWYQRAAELGSTAASQQLAGLGDPR